MKVQNNSINSLILFALILFSTQFLTNCKDPEPIAPGVLAFDRDSVKFDSIFTTLPSPTQRLMIFNTTNHPVIINKISFQNGSASEFILIFDGDTNQVISNYELAAGDSVWALITLKPQNNFADDFKIISDDLVLSSGNFEAKIPLEAKVKDAYFLRDAEATKDTTFARDKPIVIDGYFYVRQRVKLTIDPGAEIYFTSRRREIENDNDHLKNSTLVSCILVDGTLNAENFNQEKVLFSSYRFGENYNETAGQWFGIIFLNESKGNIIENALIKNATIGIRVDSIGLEVGNPKLSLTNVEIRNMEYHGLLGLGFDTGQNPTNNNKYSIVAKNVLITNCNQGYAAAFLYGGSYKLINCTFANFKNNFNGKNPSVGVTNYYKKSENEYIPFPLRFESYNNIFWGNDEEELEVSILENTTPEIAISYNLIKDKKELFKGNQNILNEDPKFMDIGKPDYTLCKESPARDKGLDTLGIKFIPDLAGNVRSNIDNSMDIGCYEFKP